MPGWVWAERRWLPFVNYEHDKDGHLIFNLGRGREIILPENVKIKEREAENGRTE